MMFAWMSENEGYASCGSVLLAGERGTEGGGERKLVSKEKMLGGKLSPIR